MEQQSTSPAPLVSIGVASYNNAQYIERTLDSIKGQDYPNWEFIIVDDCSKDNSVEVIKQWLTNNPGVQARLIINEQNAGTPRVFNKILAASQGEYLSIIGSDDIYLPHKMAMQVAVMQQLGSSYGMCYSDIIRIDEHDNVRDNGAVVVWEQGKPEGQILPFLLRGNFLPAMGVLIRCSIFQEIGGFDETLCFEDWEMWLRIADHYQIKYVPGVVAHYRVHGTSAMSTRFKLILEDSVRILKRYKGRSAETDVIIDNRLANLSKELYMYGSPTAGSMLRQMVLKKPTIPLFTYTLLATAGVKYEMLAGSYRGLKKLFTS